MKKGMILLLVQRRKAGEKFLQRSRLPTRRIHACLTLLMLCLHRCSTGSNPVSAYKRKPLAPPNFYLTSSYYHIAMSTQRPRTSQSMLMRNDTGDTSNLSQEPTPRQNYTAPIGNSYMPVETLSDEATYSLVAENTRKASRDSPLSLPDHLYTIWLDRWTTKILSCILSLAALAGLVLTLRFLDGHVVTEVPLAVSVNAVVAMFATVIKTSLILPVTECTNVAIAVLGDLD
jgi:hypothetical protein